LIIASIESSAQESILQSPHSPLLSFSRFYNCGILISWWEASFGWWLYLRAHLLWVKVRWVPVNANMFPSIEMLAQSCFCLFLLFIQIVIHVQSDMLETLIEILQSAAEGNLSRFVKRYQFAEEVVSVNAREVF
jgi:hypothetical protein